MLVWCRVRLDIEGGSDRGFFHQLPAGEPFVEGSFGEVKETAGKRWEGSNLCGELGTGKRHVKGAGWSGMRWTDPGAAGHYEEVMHATRAMVEPPSGLVMRNSMARVAVQTMVNSLSRDLQAIFAALSRTGSVILISKYSPVL